MIDTVGRSPRLVRRLLLGGLGVALLVPGVVWWVGHAATLQASASTGVPSCEGTELTTVKDRKTGFKRVAVPLSSGFACTLTIKLENHSEREVVLGEVIVPVGGASGGGGFKVTSVGGVKVPAGESIDASADLAWEVGPGDEALVDVQVVFREDGCIEKGGWMWLEPEIELHSLVASRELVIADWPAFLGTADSQCRL